MLGLGIHQRRDDISQCRQREINGLSLLESGTGSFRFGLPLRTGQIDQIQLTCFERLLIINGLRRLDI